MDVVGEVLGSAVLRMCDQSSAQIVAATDVDNISVPMQGVGADVAAGHQSSDQPGHQAKGSQGPHKRRHAAVTVD